MYSVKGGNKMWMRSHILSSLASPIYLAVSTEVSNKLDNIVQIPFVMQIPFVFSSFHCQS